MLSRLPGDIKALATTPLFRDLSKRELTALQRIGTIVEITPRRLVSRPGERPAQLAVIVRGRIVATSEVGLRRVLRDGEWLGTIDGLGNAVVEPETYRTVVTTTLFVMNAHECAALRVVCPRLAARCSGLTGLPPRVGQVTGPRAGAARVPPGGSARKGWALPHRLRPAMHDVPVGSASRTTATM
jgi:hypothetical protein